MNNKDKHIRNTVGLSHQPETWNVSAVISQYSGPLPPAYELERYEKIVPWSASLIMNAFLNQTSHRQELEKLVISEWIIREKWWLLFGYPIALFGIAEATYCAYIGATVIGSVVWGATLVGLVWIFVIGKYQTSAERIKKERMLIEHERQLNTKP